MRQAIPQVVIGIVAEAVAESETHASMDSLFLYAGSPGDPPEGSKHNKALEWLRRINKDPSIENPLEILGRIIEAYMEADTDPVKNYYADTKVLAERKDKITNALTRCNLSYSPGGVISSAVASPSKSLEQHIRSKNISSITIEFDRALKNVENSPREAVSAACNILESICKVYIHDEKLDMPAKQDLKPVWTAVRNHLGFDPSVIEDNDLKVILTGLFATVDGIGALRTHASSAHGSGRKVYKLEPRHARLAVHAAHTIALFILESWQKNRERHHD